MWTWNKFKKLIFAAGLCFALPMPAQACIPLNPICLFQMILKVTPGMPVMDFVSIPAVIPHIPAAVQKEANAKIKQMGDELLKKIRSQEVPSASDMDVKPKTPEVETLAEGQVNPSLEGFPNIDLDDPIEVAKAIEVIYVRPGWDSSPDFTTHDRALLEYQRNQFMYNNVIEVTGYLASMQSRLKDLSVFVEHVQKQIDEGKDLNDAMRANYTANYMDYKLMIIYNQLLAAQLQMDTARRLAIAKTVLDEPVLGSWK